MVRKRTLEEFIPSCITSKEKKLQQLLDYQEEVNKSNVAWFKQRVFGDFNSSFLQMCDQLYFYDIAMGFSFCYKGNRLEVCWRSDESDSPHNRTGYYVHKLHGDYSTYYLGVFDVENKLIDYLIDLEKSLERKWTAVPSSEGSIR